jgi:glutathione synthase/RimK-type ligase-like ATP-grasp enzyme
VKVIIIGNSAATPTEKERAYYQQYVDFFQQSASHSSESVDVRTALFDDLFIEVGEDSFVITDTQSDLELSKYNAIFLRGDKFRASMDIIATINAYAEAHGIFTINTYENIRDSSKLLQAVNFEQIGVPVARTLLVNSALFAKFSSGYAWSFPCIMKARHGSHGNDNYLVNSIDEVREIAERDAAKGFVLQRFVENDGDYRILMIGGETLVIGRNAQEGTHLNNTSQGGSASLVENDSLPEKVLQDARKITAFYKMTIAGVDALQSKETGEFYFLEVNAQPQLMTGAFTDKKAEMIGKLFDDLRDKR